MSNIVKIIVAVVLFCLALGVAHYLIKPDKSPIANIDMVVDQAIANINQRAPIAIDPMTILKSADRDSTVINYNLKFQNLNIKPEDTAKFAHIQKTSNAVNSCSSPEISGFIENGYMMAFHYNDELNNKLFSVQIDQSDCEIIGSNDVQEIFEYFVENNSSALPLKVDNLTNWQDISIVSNPIWKSGDRLMFTYKLFTTLKDDIDINMFKERMSMVTLQKNCVMQDMQLVLRKGGTVMDRYIDKNDVVITEFKSDIERCVQSSIPQQ